MEGKRQIAVINDLPNNKLITSPYWAYCVNAVRAGISGRMLCKILNEDKKFKVSLREVQLAIKYIKKYNCDAVKLIQKGKEAAELITQDMKRIGPALSNTLQRRSSLLQELVERKKAVLEAQKEGNRTNMLVDLLMQLKELTKSESASKAEIEQLINVINNFVTMNFTSRRLVPQYEQLIRNYIMDIHEVFKYAEQWTSKYDIYNLLEKLSYDITAVSIKVFGQYLKQLTREEREELVKKYGEEVKKVLQNISVDELKIEDDTDYDEQKYR